MAADIVPDLLETMRAEFRKRLENNKTVVRMQNRIRDGTATMREVHEYAAELGRELSSVLLKNLTGDVLPGGKLYWNIADRIIRPLLMGNYNLTNEAAKAVQKAVDEAQGLYLNAVSGEIPEERITNLINHAVSEDTLEHARIWLDEPIVNCSESFFDDFTKANADFRYNAGLETLIIRTAAGNCCDWCANLEGTYKYGEDVHSGDDVFRRHLYCRCVVTEQTNRTRENVWNKRLWQIPQSQRDALKTFGAEITRLSPQEAALSAIEMERRDQEIARIMKDQGVSRERAASIYSRRRRG